jgi:hypothetical protein
MIFATHKPTKDEYLESNFEMLRLTHQVHPLLLDTMQVTLSNLRPPAASTLVFTDDRAQIEWLTNGLVLNFLLSGETEILQ